MSSLNYEKYLYYKDIEEHLLYLSEKYPDLIKLNVIEKTDMGRNMYLAEISFDVQNEKTNEKGGYYVQGSIHASECGGSSAAMHLIDTLLEKKPDILNDVVFYVLPRANPDNVEENMLTNIGIRSLMKRDMNFRESVVIPKDMDGDGLILSMRRKNPLGDFKEVSPGVMVLRKPGDTDEFYDVWQEGEIENFNGSTAHYSIRNYDFNRCFPSTWEPIVSSSEYPLRDKEPRAIAEFLVTHPNIFAGVDFHNGYNGILRPPMMPDSKMNKEDLELVVKIGELASEITGFPLIHEYMYGGFPNIRHGDINDFFFHNLGISHYVIELGNGINDIGVSTETFFNEGKTDDDYEKEVIEYQMSNGNPICHPYKPFFHSQLGEIEIGGIESCQGYEMNAKNLPAIIEKTTEFVLKHAKMGPVIKADNIEVEKYDDNVLRIRAQIKNIGIFGTKVIKGTQSYQAQYPVHVSLESDGEFQIFSRPNIYEIPALSSMQSEYLEWFVKCDENTSLYLKVSHPKAKTVEVKII